MEQPRNFVLEGITTPEKLASLSLRGWDQLIRHGRKEGVLGTIHHRLDAVGLLESVPDAPRNHLIAAANLASLHKRVLTWEVYCVGRALAHTCPDFVLLKGAAYLFSGLPHAVGRLQSDLDILVPRTRLDAVESTLVGQGWQQVKLESYDQRYYRRWSHELPPLIHNERRTVIDIHHNILPAKSRLRPDAAKILSAAEPIPDTSYRRLSPDDMVLHAAAHMFHDGDFSRAVRELADLDGLLRHFSRNEDFWARLMQRGPELDLKRPLFYALRYSRQYLQTPVPESVLHTSDRWRPPGPALRAMDGLFAKTMEPAFSPTAGESSARWLLYARSHWLRMPPLLLVRHLTHQSLRRFSTPGTE